MSFLASLAPQLFFGLAPKRAADLLSPAAPQAPKGPSDADVAAAADLEAQAEQRRLARGRTSTLLTGGTGLTDMGTTSKTLLGR